jgi:hypothetical protein
VIVNHDEDIELKTVHELRGEVRKLRHAIRHHRDMKGNDRCWMDDLELYGHLPEGHDADLSLPTKEDFLRRCAAYCERFWSLRQRPEES